MGSGTNSSIDTNSYSLWEDSLGLNIDFTTYFFGCMWTLLNLHLLIGAEGAKTPAGVRGWGDPAGAKRTRRLPGTPAESEAPGAQINRHVERPIYLLCYNKLTR
jgi:hypothetical protein